MNFQQLAWNSRSTFALEVEPGLSLTGLVLRGREPGPTLGVLGAVHGDEYEGVMTVLELFRSLDTAQFAGTVLMLPVTNLPAYQAQTRRTPQDDTDLARVFPGDPHGSLSQRLAYLVGQQFIAPANLLIDLHSSGTAMTSPTLIGFCQQPGQAGIRSQQAALTFGAQVIWRHPGIDPGRTISMAADLGIPAIYTEANGGLRVKPDDLMGFARGVRGVMGWLGMAEPVAVEPPQYYLGGAGNTDAMVRFASEGVFFPRVSVLEEVQPQQLLGQVYSLAGQLVEELRAPQAGRVVFMRAIPRVNPGDQAVLIAQEVSPARWLAETGAL